jgi:hypothetical protein
MEALPGELILRFKRLVRVAYTTHPHSIWFFAGNFPLQQLGGVDFYVNKLSPGLLVPGKALHETSITVAAIVLAACVRVDDVGVDLRLRKDGFRINFLNDHTSIIGAIRDLKWRKKRAMKNGKKRKI